MLEDCKKEIIELHKFFEDWYRGVLANNDENFSRFEQVMGENFSIISPGGQQLSRDQIIGLVKDAHNSRKYDDSPIRIWIKNINLLHETGELALLRYEEWQEANGQVSGRISTVFFESNAETPNNLLWKMVHETWLPGKSPTG